MVKILFWLMLTAAIFTAPLYAQTKQASAGLEKSSPPKKIKMLTKNIQGTVSARNMNGVAVVYDADKNKYASYEMWMPFDSKMKLAGYKTLTEMQEGDKIAIVYEEAEDGSVKITKELKLRKKAPKDLVSEEKSDEL